MPLSAFEPAMEKLEQLVRQMEEGSLTLEQSLAAYKEGAALVAQCRAALEQAERQVKILEESAGGVGFKPFEPDQP